MSDIGIPITPIDKNSMHAATSAQIEARAFTDRGLLEAIYILLRRDDILRRLDQDHNYQRGWDAGYECGMELGEKALSAAENEAEARGYRLGKLDERNGS